MNMNSDLGRLSRIIGYKFNNQELLSQALTHRSANKKNNERLEFLGDTVLSTSISELLFHQFAQAQEGDLSRMRSSLVCEKTLASIAKEFSLADFLFLGGGELKSGGFRRESILADALEAIIGAIYLDSDFDTCRKLLAIWFAKRLKDVTPEQLKDPKTRLQEELQRRHLDLPIYEVVSITGEDHNLTFEISCKISEIKKVITAKGASKRKAEQIAAVKMLELL